MSARSCVVCKVILAFVTSSFSKSSTNYAGVWFVNLEYFKRAQSSGAHAHYIPFLILNRDAIKAVINII